MGRYDNPAEARRKKGKPYRIAIVLAIIVFMLLAPEMQEGSYMNPTVKDGQVMVLTKSRYSAKRKAPEHDRLVVLDKTVSLNAGAEDNIVTRVVAVPGDTVEIRDGRLLVNDETYVSRGGIKGCPGKFERKKLKGNEIFVLSDNRKISRYDSRNPKLGLVDMRKIRGDIVVCIWPLNEFSFLKDK